MGNLATPEALLLRWEEMLRDPSLQDLPYKIELNAWGKVEMSPPGVGHARLQAAVAVQLTQQLQDGVALTECPVLTGISPPARRKCGWWPKPERFASSTARAKDLKAAFRSP